MTEKKRTAEKLLKDELDIDLSEEKDWEDHYRKEYEDILEFYTAEEKGVLDKIYGKNVNLFGEEIAPEDELDEEKLEEYINHIIARDAGLHIDKQLTPKKKKKKKRTQKKLYWYGGDYVSPPAKKSTRVLRITKKAFQQIRKIADEQDLYYGFECAGFLYGKKDIITKVKKYNCFASAGLVSGNPMDVYKQSLKKKYIGLFHSHLFNSSSPSRCTTPTHLPGQAPM